MESHVAGRFWSVSKHLYTQAPTHSHCIGFPHGIQYTLYYQLHMHPMQLPYGSPQAYTMHTPIQCIHLYNVYTYKMYIPIQCIHLHTCTNACVCMETCLFIHEGVLSYTCICACMCMHVCTCMHRYMIYCWFAQSKSTNVCLAPPCYSCSAWAECT